MKFPGEADTEGQGTDLSVVPPFFTAMQGHAPPPAPATILKVVLALHHTGTPKIEKDLPGDVSIFLSPTCWVLTFLAEL